jgi:hypothetical protein
MLVLVGRVHPDANPIVCAVFSFLIAPFVTQHVPGMSQGVTFIAFSVKSMVDVLLEAALQVRTPVQQRTSALVMALASMHLHLHSMAQWCCHMH